MHGTHSFPRALPKCGRITTPCSLDAPPELPAPRCLPGWPSAENTCTGRRQKPTHQHKTRPQILALAPEAVRENPTRVIQACTPRIDLKRQNNCWTHGIPICADNQSHLKRRSSPRPQHLQGISFCQPTLLPDSVKRDAICQVACTQTCFPTSDDSHAIPRAQRRSERLGVGKAGAACDCQTQRLDIKLGACQNNSTRRFVAA